MTAREPWHSSQRPRRLGAAGAAVILGVAISVACGSDDAASDPGAVPSPESGSPVDTNDAAPMRAAHGLDARPSNTTCRAPARPPPAGPVRLERVFTNVTLTNAVMLAQMPGDRSRIFVAQQGTSEGGMGEIVSFPVASPPAVPSVVATVGPLAFVPGEGGLLGFAFDPKCTAQSCRLYVSFVGQGQINYGRSRIAYLTSNDNGASFTGLTEVLGFEDTYGPTHKGGGIAFGKDGYLYVSFGDGDGPDDSFVVGQNRNRKAAKVLRIDVTNVPPGQTYGIPASNPFKNGGGDPAVFAYGFRNPFRVSLDRASGDLWVGDVGQDHWEEINRVEVGGNYGWPCREGAHPYLDNDPVKCPSKLGLLDPVVEYAHVNVPYRSVTGGVVYRGAAIPSFVGTYVYGDFTTGEVFTLTFDPTTGAPKTGVIADTPPLDWTSFSEDLDGEVYGVGLTTGITKLVAAASPAPSSVFPDRLSKTGCTDTVDVKKAAPGLLPYGVNAPFWSDGATKERFFAVPDQATISVDRDGHLVLPTGSVVMKTFALAGKAVETRLMVRHEDGEWAGYTYEWLDDQSDALLLPSSARKVVGTQSWYFPGRGECMRCHTEAAGRVLGLELGQLNGDFTYAQTKRIANQLETLDHIGIFAPPLGKKSSELPVVPSPSGAAPLEERARAYLHTSCAYCHRPNGGGRGPMDLRFTTPLASAQMCNVDAATGNLGIAGAKLLVPGSAARSLVSVRPHALDARRMPPLGSSVVDEGGLAVLDGWITGLTACP